MGIKSMPIHTFRKAREDEEFGTPARMEQPKAREDEDNSFAAGMGHRWDRIGVQAPVQAKLTVSEPGDEQEQEADRVANAVMRMPEGEEPQEQEQEQETSQPTDSIMRMPEGEEPQEEQEAETIQTMPLGHSISRYRLGPSVQRKEEPEGEESDGEEEAAPPEQVQAKPLKKGVMHVPPGLEEAIHRMRGGGEILPRSTQLFFEKRLGHDLSRVRIHADQQAGHIANSLGAKAFTRGSDIAFGLGWYQPRSVEGRFLLGHELAHAIQQGKAATLQTSRRVIENQAVSQITNYGLIQRNARGQEELQRAEEKQGTVKRGSKGYANRDASNPKGARPSLSDAQREVLYTTLVGYMSQCLVFFDRACHQVEHDIEVEQAANRDLVVGLIAMAITYVVPGLGSAITRLVNNFPNNAPSSVCKLALGILDRAPAIASTIGEAGKRAAPMIVQKALKPSSERAFFNATVEGFANAQRAILNNINSNINDRKKLSDTEFYVYVAFWDPENHPIENYAQQLRTFYDNWKEQVRPIGEKQEVMEERSNMQFRLVETQVGVVWVKYRDREVLVLAKNVIGGFGKQLEFMSFIHKDLKDMAIARAEKSQPKGIQTIPWNAFYFVGMPMRVPSTAAHRSPDLEAKKKNKK